MQVVSPRIVFEVRRQNEWLAGRSRSTVATIAAGRLIKGRGRFTIIAPFRGTSGHQAPNLPRRAALDALWHLLGEMRAGDMLHVRDGKGAVALVVKAAWAIDPRRTDMADWARWGTAHAAQIHYSQARPYTLYHPRHLEMTLDCSSSSITYAHWAGAPDPSGYGFNGSGNTDAILRHLRPRLSIADAELGDLILWHKGSDGKHVAVVVKPGRDPLLASHGSENGPLLLRFSVEYRYHAGETATALDLLS